MVQRKKINVHVYKLKQLTCTLDLQPIMVT
jgi:hypothetical protein